MQSHKYSAWVQVNLDALTDNAATLAQRAGVPLLPMIKADAYGLGALQIADALQSVGPWGFGVATIEEGAALRSAGVKLPIVVFTPVMPDQFPDVRHWRLTPAFGDAETIVAWCRDPGDPWHLAVETGMNRAGIRLQDIPRIGAALVSCRPEGVFTHFHSADLDDGSMAAQEVRFRSAVRLLPQRPEYLHTENSAAIARRERSEWDLVRPGVFLYGIGSGAGAAIQPRSVVTLAARVVEVRTVEAGDGVSYGATYLAPDARTIATTALGYADGYRRAFGGNGRALLNGVTVPVVGVVTMDMTMLDVTGVGCEPGDIANFAVGLDDSGLTADHVSRAAGVSPYEFLAGLRMRLPRVYSHGNAAGGD
jgi:alanine racemase